jgi:tRNA (adenine22-N1)-methyltransferase
MDIGTDHALVPSFAALRGICERAVGVDLRPEPLRRARQTLRTLGVEGQVELVLGDGLGAVKEPEKTTVVIAGLSGKTMLSWCEKELETVRRLDKLVVQPNGHLSALRAWAYESGLWLLDERICQERDRFFVSCAFASRQGGDPAYENLPVSMQAGFELGPWLVRRGDPLASQCYLRERRRLAGLVGLGLAEHRELFAIYDGICSA